MASTKLKKTPKIVSPSQISTLLQALNGSSVDEITITNDGSSIRLIRDALSCKREINVVNTVKAASPEIKLEEAEKTESLEDAEKTTDILSSEVGVFMRAKDAKSPMLVKLRDEVKLDQVLAFIKSTGIMYEVKSTHSGKIIEILVEDGQAVEYAQPLFRLK